MELRAMSGLGPDFNQRALSLLEDAYEAGRTEGEAELVQWKMLAQEAADRVASLRAELVDLKAERAAQTASFEGLEQFGPGETINRELESFGEAQEHVCVWVRDLLAKKCDCGREAF